MRWLWFWYSKFSIDGDVPRSTSYGVYISQIIPFARVSSHVADFNARNKSLTAKLLQQGYRYHKLRKTFSKFYRRNYELVSKFSVGLKTLLHQGLSQPEFYGDLVYKFKKIVGRADFSDQFKKIIVRYKRIGYNINIMQQSACLVTQQNQQNDLCTKWRLRSACPSLLSDQSLRCVLNGQLRTQCFFMGTAKTLIRLGRYQGWSKCLLGTHIGFVMLLLK